jgi:hypothetical protein
MNNSIEMHDSVCLSIEADDSGRGSVLLDAYVHRTEGDPGRSDGEGGTQRIRMRLGSLMVRGVVGELPADIYHGSLTVGELTLNNMIPFPATHVGPILLHMMLSDDARIVEVLGRNVSIEAEDEFQFVETCNFSKK